MYEQHFGLAKAPFRITPDPEFFFPGGNRGAVLEALVYAVSRGEGIVKVVGEVGSGKTMLCRMLEQELPAGCEMVYLANPRLGPDEILHAIAFELGIECDAGDTKLKVLHALQDFLLAKHAHNIRVIMFVEEAQGMPVETLEEIRMLSNLETTRDKLLQIVLFGQPELDDTLSRHEIRQLRERITHGFELAPLAFDEIRDYVNSRLRASGYRGNGLFSAAALREVERYSSGLLRRINVLADKALLAAFADGEAAVRPAHVRRAARDSEFGGRYRPPRTAWWRLGFGLGALLLVAAGALYLGFGQEILPHVTGGAEPSARTPSGSATVSEAALVGQAGVPPAPEIRARIAEPLAATAVTAQFDDNRTEYPVVSPVSGMVTLDHLRPLPAAPDAGLSEAIR